jgi:hypothetical protein
MGAAGPAYKITQVDDDFSEQIYRRIRGVFHTPLYLNTELPIPEGPSLSD